MRFAKAQEKKMGKPETTQVVKPRGPQKSPISKGWVSTWPLNSRTESSMLTTGNSSPRVRPLRRSPLRTPEAVLLSQASPTPPPFPSTNPHHHNFSKEKKPSPSYEATTASCTRRIGHRPHFPKTLSFCDLSLLLLHIGRGVWAHISRAYRTANSGSRNTNTYQCHLYCY